MGILRCQNRSENERVFYNYIYNAEWYHQLSNGTTHQFGTSGPVQVQNYSLVFHQPVRTENEEGTYFCCKPGGSCSEKSTMIIVGTYVHMYT